MTIHQEHFGRKFYKDHKTGYWISTDYSKEQPRTRAHRWVWLSVHKVIPKGYHIHHVNDDKSDNRIENLELIKGSRHLSLHMQCPIRKQMARENINRIRPLTKVWHASEEGRKWHRIHAAKCNFGNSSPRKYICEQCSKEFFSKISNENHTRFCGNNCKSQWRRESGLDNIEKICQICKNPYITNKYSISKTCSRLCGQELRRKR